MNLHLYPSPFRFESRILRIVRSLKARAVFDQIVVAAWWEEDLRREEQVDPGINVVRLGRKPWPGVPRPLAKVLALLRFARETTRRFGNESLECVNPHSLSMLPLAVLLKWRTGCSLIYDTHELETETVRSRGLRRELARLLERTLIGYADHVFVVSDSINDWYRRAYRRDDVTTIKNYPTLTARSSSTSVPLRELLGIEASQLVFLYQGYLSEGRGIHLMLEAFAELATTAHLVLMGSGPLAPAVEKAARLSTRVHLLPPVPPDRVLGVTMQANVGISLIEPACLSYRFCLPNKLLEYLSCGVPAIVSALPDMSRLVSDHNCGWFVSPSGEALRELVASLDLDRVKVAAEGAERWRSTNHWGTQESALITVYEALARQRA